MAWSISDGRVDQKQISNFVQPNDQNYLMISSIVYGKPKSHIDNNSYYDAISTDFVMTQCMSCFIIAPGTNVFIFA